MKKLIVVVLLIIVIAAGLPFLNGVLLERVLKNSVDMANAMQADNPFGYSIEIVNYKRSYTATDLELKLDMGILKDIYGIDSIVINENAKHGFIGVRSTTSLKGNEWYDSFIEERLNGQDPLHIETFYSLLGGIESDVRLDAFSTNIENIALNIKKAEIKVMSDKSLQNYNISGNWQGFDIDKKFSVNEVSIGMNMEMVTQSLWDGDADINIKSVDVTDKGQNVKISDLNIETESNVNQDANTMGLDIYYDISSIRSGDKNIEDITLHMGLNGLKIDALEEFRKTYFDFVSQIVPKLAINDPSKLNNEQMRKEIAQMNLKMVAAYEKLLREGLELQVSDVHVKLPQGEVKGDVTLRLLKDMTFAQFLPFINQPEGLYDALYLKTYISLPVALVGENPQLTMPPVPEMKTGFFIKNGDFLVNRMETKDGKLILNDNVVPLNEIASQLSPGPRAGNPYMNKY